MATERIEDREDFVDVLAQAVIDKMDETRRMSFLVEQVAARVIALQKAEALAQAERAAAEQADAPAKE